MPGGQMRQARPAQPHVRAASNARPITGKISLFSFVVVCAQMLYSCATIDCFRVISYIGHGQSLLHCHMQIKFWLLLCYL